jgi:hypothetical protein
VAEETILQFLKTPTSLNRLSPASHELLSKQPLITSVQKNTQGYDLITGKILKELLAHCIQTL